ncbi:penicillin-binding protein activator [Chitinibacter bivalviorum]|uniref:Penicillin-binding protein activator n=1 Tax=Chitinibacter bivalviorum TaxID=2739434 RepID=A0A7H9BIN5_9NEIS|nr:penicillin-binding protein activator [Chitinibacter bivalviorum]QLG88329.1 penicillin-binding protein activator [Chitinibacter bivalviorum]
MKTLLGLRATAQSAATVAKMAAKMTRLVGASALLYGALASTATIAHAQETVESLKPSYIALLLPGNAKAFKPAVDSIRAGVLAAERVYGGADSPLVRVFDTTDKEEDIQAQYKKAVEGGAKAVIGPLTKSALNFLADSTEIKVPVVALNGFDQTTLPQTKLYSFGLAVEADAMDTAQQMKLDGLHQVVVLQSADTLGQRLAQGFASAWEAKNGSSPTIISIGNAKRDASGLKEQLSQAYADSVFLAMDAKNARIIRPFLGNERPVYATSQIDPGRLGATTMVDLTGVKYLDMPWLANPKQEGYELYNRTRSSSNDLERLFALGVDAWRIAAILINDGTIDHLEGLTGILTMGDNNVISREMVLRTMGRSASAP